MSAAAGRRLRVVVVGGGIAGLTAAIEASACHDVVLVTKGALTESTTQYAQGGVAVVLDPASRPGVEDSVAAHVADTLSAGAGLVDRAVAEAVCGGGPDAVADLVRWGTRFDRDDGRFALGLEAAHSAPRILHAAGDATGAELVRALVARLHASDVEVREHTFVTDLVVNDGVVAGVAIVGDPSGPPHTLVADAVVLATGGAGQLYAHTTNPAVATADGLAVAMRAGAVVGDLEMYQFHPTRLAVPGGGLISEAVRGEGAVLRDARGHRFMREAHPDAELAPRDVVAREIARVMREQGGEPVRLDATSLGADFLARRFPGLDARCRAHGLRWDEDPIPVTPAAHYFMGGVRTDLDGRTTVPGLYAVGEVACTGLHGANRLASNSLLEGAVMARRCVAALGVQAPAPWDGEPSPYEDLPPALAATPVDRARLQATMWAAAGLVRDGQTLAAAADTLAGWRAVVDGTTAAYEDANLLEVARVVVMAALAREESRGAHFRTDHPERDHAFDRHLSWVRKGGHPC
ncbi:MULTISPECIES: L-aspartate oxidase [Mumia]|uniref:L-aspartate oxidase n=1 Tax=Mumia TaxID=1546255 RepID=UPI00141F1B3D|nr:MULTISPECIES: L-aspartate oxidase [unclassified Mumia]QMW65515.1 L-aspartate oxidase [Mumia sp. ZJ1417]